MKLRPHHILCVPFFTMVPPGRGEDFERISHAIRAMMTVDEDTLIEVNCGVDDLCAACPSLGGNGCVSPFGDEEKVRRWDVRVMEGLNLKYGDVLAAGDLRRLIRRKAPLDFCRQRCVWKSVCAVFGPSD
jgi:uncharacterized protein